MGDTKTSLDALRKHLTENGNMEVAALRALQAYIDRRGEIKEEIRLLRGQLENVRHDIERGRKGLGDETCRLADRVADVFYDGLDENGREEVINHGWDDVPNARMIETIECLTSCQGEIADERSKLSREAVSNYLDDLLLLLETLGIKADDPVKDSEQGDDDALTLDDYQQKAARTLRDDNDIAWNVLGLVGEAGEVAEYFKKTLYHKHPEDREKARKELGDVLWYVAAIATKLGLSLGDIAAANIAKLEERYPDGFSTEASLARVDEKGGAGLAMAAGLIYPDPYERQSFGAGQLEEEPFLQDLCRNWIDIVAGGFGPIVPGGSTRLSHRKVDAILRAASTTNPLYCPTYLQAPVRYVFTPALFFANLRGSDQTVYNYTWKFDQPEPSWERHMIYLRQKTKCEVLGWFGGAYDADIQTVVVPLLTRDGWQGAMSNPDKLVRRESSICALITQTVSVDDPLLQMIALEDVCLKRFVDFFSRPYYHPTEDEP